MKKKVIKSTVLLTTLLFITPSYANFNFGECSGSGTFEQNIKHYRGDFENVVIIGNIPAGIQGLRIDLISSEDVDIRLYGENDDKIVHWPHGILNQENLATKQYQDVDITYSGYNGVNGQKGHEFIEVATSTPTAMTMKAFGYRAGYATVNYSWVGKDGCEASHSGSDTFRQVIPNEETALVGTIPPNINNLYIKLISDKDIDIQLFSVDGTPIVSWQPTGILAGPEQQSTNYHGMQIEWSGYSGTNGNVGHEYIKITGLVTEVLVMKVYGYEAGVASVEYRWGSNIFAKYPPTTKLAFRATDNTVQKPQIGIPSNDNVFGTRIFKVAKNDDSIAIYPKVQSWNKDMTLLRIGSRLYDSDTLEESIITRQYATGGDAYRALCSRNSDYFRWSNTTSNRFYVLNSSRQFVRGEINNNQTNCSNIIESFSEFEEIHIGPYEGNIDYNDQYVVFSAKKFNDTKIYIILYDIVNDTRVWMKALPESEWIAAGNGWKPKQLDWVSISPSGHYILVNNIDKANYTEGMYRYDIDFSNAAKLQYEYNGVLYSEGGHGDIGYDTEGNEVLVQFLAGLGVYSFNLDNPTEKGKELLTSPYGGGHISCRNTRRPGWCYITTREEGYNQVFALKLDGTNNETVQNFSQSHSLPPYYRRTYGGASPDGTKIIFNSNWGNTDPAQIDTFVVETQ